MIRRSLLAVAMLITLNESTLGHECILQGTNTSDIAAYNACKNDLAFGTAGHTDTDSTATSDRIKVLETENEALKAKILILKGQLLNLFRVLE